MQATLPHTKQAQPFFATVAYFLDVENLQSGVSCLTYQLPYFKGPDLRKTAESTRSNNTRWCKMWCKILLLIKSDFVKDNPGISKIRAVTVHARLQQDE